MPIDFHAEQNRFSYITRQADSSWREMIESIVDVRDKHVLDIGCGGGIYSKALTDMGAVRVTGLDFSEEMLKGAREHCQDYTNISFTIGDALNTGLPTAQYDLILERALIHHLKSKDLHTCFAEAFRLLKPGGTLIVQDRTPADCVLSGSPTHIRGYFFERYPKLTEREVARRYKSEFVLQLLHNAGFKNTGERKLWETRAIYSHVDALAEDLLARTGRSILHELTDKELQELVKYIQKQLQGNSGQEIVEQDRWTVWSAVRTKLISCQSY